MQGPRRIELLAPARNIETARAAIQHGADAIYIGAPRFGARAAAGVPLEDLRQLCCEAHLFGVRVYVTLNTIIYDEELTEVEALIWEIYRAGADALIIQDLGITMMNLPPIPLHSSTQCDTVEPEDALQLEALGFEQIVLARELNVEQIRRIKAVATKPLEVFIHGALCVSYSGRCYISQAFTQRSANRGECSQQCRLAYDLLDSRGNIIRHQEHLLSARDLNRTNLLENLLDAGASSLKIEGRLKSISYVKNITAHYRSLLDEIIKKQPTAYVRSSYGQVSFRFTPNPFKSFNRGFTDYQFELPNPENPKVHVVNIHSPKSQGEFLGEVDVSSVRSWQLRTQIDIANGDGLLYVTPDGVVGGVNVNRSLGRGEITPARPLKLPVGTKVYRNHDQEWERLLSGPTAERRLSIIVKLSRADKGLALTLQCVEGRQISIVENIPFELEKAKRFDEDRLRTELTKFGDTIFSVVSVEIDFAGEEYFVPLSLLAQLRRSATASLMSKLMSIAKQDISELTPLMQTKNRSELPFRPHFVPDYRANIANHLARKHYEGLGYKETQPAFELDEQDTAYLMCTKHCIKHELGYCAREKKEKMPYPEPLYLEQGGRRIRLEFDCNRCQMYLFKA